MLAEVAARRRFDAVQAVAEVDLVEVELENLGLLVQHLDAFGEDELLQLPADGLVGREEALTRELLRDRAAALRGAAVADVGERGRRDANQVEPVMLVETLIFDRDDRVDQIRRIVGQRHVDALFVEDREGELVVGVVRERGLVHVADSPDRLFAGKARAGAREQARRRCRAP